MKNFCAIIVVACIVLCGCNSSQSSSDRQLALQTEQSMKEANAQIGMPAIKNFQERKLAKMIFELRDQENYVCHAYLVNQMTGQVGQYLGKCLGYGLPYSVQYTNPMKIVEGDKELGYDLVGVSDYMQVLPQQDPNGLFMPEGLSATWLMLLDENGEARPVYVEPEIIVSPFPLHNTENP